MTINPFQLARDMARKAHIRALEREIEAGIYRQRIIREERRDAALRGMPRTR